MNPDLISTITKLKELREQNLKLSEMLSANMAKYKADLNALDVNVRKAKINYYRLVDGPVEVKRIIYPRLRVA